MRNRKSSIEIPKWLRCTTREENLRLTAKRIAAMYWIENCSLHAYAMSVKVQCWLRYRNKRRVLA